MKRLSKLTSSPKALSITAAALLAGLASSVLAAPQVIYNGNPAGAVRTVGGTAYIKVADMARALGMVAVKRSDGSYDIRKAGGAHQVNGVMQGKIGDVLFDGKWRFQVLGMRTVGSYTMKTHATSDYSVYNAVADFDSTTGVYTPKSGYTLIALSCRVTNARNQMESLWRASSDTRTALADTQGESHPPIAYDMEESAPFQSKALLPGSKLDMTVLFSVPTGTQVKDLVFTLRTIDNSDRGNDVRVSLGG